MDLPQSSIRETILIESARLFVQRGYDGISMREIAEACSLSKAGIYYHFKDKEDLFLALLEANLNTLHRLWEDSTGVEGCRARLTRFTGGMFEGMGKDERGVIRLANQEMVKLSPQRREAFGTQYQRLFLNPLSDCFAAGMQSGEIKPVDPHLLVWLFLGMLYPLFSPSSEPRAEMLAAALEIFFSGAAL